MSERSHIISVVLENEFGALSRVANLFSARGYNIESLNVAPTTDPTLSRMTITTIGSERVLEQIIKQLNKLIDVVDAFACTTDNHHTGEYALMRLAQNSAVVKLVSEWQLNDAIDLRLIEQKNDQLVAAVSADTFTLELMLESLSRSDLLEISRSGALAVKCSQPGSSGAEST
ncbi:MAG: acetolactate synthase small subunit [Proteobacteria bacterium]|nr:acetolactate synthase small subunit [Pseudomonadota bacterium]